VPITVTMSTGVLAPLIVGVVVLVAAFVTTLLLFIRRRRRRVQAAVAADLSSEAAVRGPESAIYQFGSGQFPRAGGNGQLALTATRLICRKYVGTDVVIPLSEITGLREQASLRHQRFGGRRFMIVATDAGEAAYAVRNVAGWIGAVEQTAPQPISSH